MCTIFTSKLMVSSILLQSRALFIDLSRIPVNKGIKSRLGWTKHSDLYEILLLSLDLNFLCLLTGAECGKGLYLVHLRCNIIYYSQLTKNKENKTCLRMNLTLTKVHKTKKPNKLYYTGDSPDIYFLQSDSVIHFFYNLKGYIGRNIYNILLAKRMKKKMSPIYTPGGS